VVSESYQWGEEFESDRGVDKVDPLPYRVGDALRPWGRGGGGLGVGEFDHFLSEGGGRGVSFQAASAGQGVLRGKKVVQECIVDSDWVRGVGKGGKPGCLSWGDQLFGRPHVVRRGLSKESSPI